MSLQPLKPASGITEQKKAELDDLTLQVMIAQNDVERNQAIVNSLTQKATDFQSFLSLAENNSTQTHHNKLLADQLIESASGLKNNSARTLSEIHAANDSTSQLSTAMKQLTDKLIYAAGLVNKLANEVIKQKALNPLISDDLVSLVGAAGKDANNAVALTLAALQSAFAAQATSQGSAALLSLEDQQAKNLYDMIIACKALLDKAYQDAKDHYHLQETAFKIITKQLTDAQTALNKAQVKLNSLQSGLSAANAAASAG